MAGAVVVYEDGRVEPAVRKLTPEEHDAYANAIASAIIVLPAYRDSIALMRPFFDASAQTAYIDKYSRVGLGPWFFGLSVAQRASVILHECSHVLHNCFIRGEILGAKPYLNNISSDLEINSGLNLVPKVDLSFGILPAKEPYHFPDFKTQEQYYHLLQENGFDTPPTASDCPQHGNSGDDDDDDDNDSSGGQGDESGDSGSDEQGESGDSGSSDDSQDGSGSGDSQDGADSGQGDQDGSGSGDDEQDGSSQGQGGGSQNDPNQNQNGGNGQKPCTCPHDSNGSGQGDPSQGQGGGGDDTKSCDEPTQERQDAADDAGIDRASDAEQSIAKKNTMARVAEEAQKARQAGKGELANFYDLALERMRPPKVHWSQIFRRLVSRIDQNVVRGRSNYSYRRVSRRITDTPFIFPGMVKYTPKAMIGIDTSGSMGDEDFMVTLQEIEGIMKASSSVRENLSVFCVDTTMKDVQPARSVKDINLKGGGGTDMAPAWEYVNSIPAKKRPDLFVLASDCWVPWEPVIEQLKLAKGYTSVILATTSGGFSTIPPEVHKLAYVIDISEE